MMKPILCIAGPTASGKSSWALELAKMHDGEVINADALQVYAELQILSARPTEAEMDGVPHHLYGHVSATERYSTGKWLKDVDDLIIDVLARGKTPILVGGTGLYFKALTEGLAQIPDPDPEATVQAQHILDQDGIDALRTEATRLDPVATARVLGDDPQRLLRIVGVALGTQHPLSVWQSNTKPLIPKSSWQGAVLLPPREDLYAKINARFADMVVGGGLVEAARVRALNLDVALPAMKAIGLRELIAHLNGETGLDEAIELAARETRRFAKRQYTWLRGQMQGWAKVETLSERQAAFDL
jgi:tRNA dimethylallyltransferase